MYVKKNRMAFPDFFGDFPEKFEGEEGKTLRSQT